MGNRCRQCIQDQYQSEDSVSRRPVPGRPRATTPAEDRFLALSARRRRTTTVPQLVADHFQASEEESPLLRCEIVFYNAGSVCKKTSYYLRFPQRTTAKELLMLGKRTCFL
ncbi:HTH_Tnp_Tc3_2 domain-containing protein, partial [Trichonephila clavipes]